MKYLGIDYGKKRIGVAISDENGKVAFPLQVMANTDLVLGELLDLAREKQVEQIVIGRSRNLDGSDNIIQGAIDSFAAELTDAGMQVVLHDEFYSTKDAAAATKDQGEKDAAAAAVILNTYLQGVKPEPVIKDIISYADFTKLDIRIGIIREVAVVEGADKLLKFQIDFGDHTRQIVSGIREYFSDEQELVGESCPFILNLEPRTIRGEVSEGMILAVGDDDNFALLHPTPGVSPGSAVR